MDQLQNDTDIGIGGHGEPSPQRQAIHEVQGTARLQTASENWKGPGKFTGFQGENGGFC